jgi:hypothetical protein
MNAFRLFSRLGDKTLSLRSSGEGAWRRRIPGNASERMCRGTGTTPPDISGTATLTKDGTLAVLI